MRGWVGVVACAALVTTFTGCSPASVLHSPKYPYVGCHKHISGSGFERVVVHGESVLDALDLLVTFIDSNMADVIVNVPKETVLPRGRCETQWMNFGADNAGRVEVP